MSDVKFQLVDEKVLVQVVADSTLIGPIIESAQTAAAEAATEAATAVTADLADQIGDTPFETTTIGNSLIAGTSALSGGVWIDNSAPIPADSKVAGASVYIMSAGSGNGSFVFVSADGGNWKVEKVIPQTGVTLGVFQASFTPFSAASPMYVGWHTPSGGSTVAVTTSGGTNLNFVPLTPVEGVSYALNVNTFIVRVAALVQSYYTLNARLDDLGSSQEFTQDRITEATVTPVALLVNYSGTIEQDGTDHAFSGSLSATAATGSNIRYDILYIQQSDRSVGRTAGTERAGDAADFLPALAAGRLPIAYLRVTSTAATAIPVWEAPDYEHRSTAAQIEIDRTRYRRALRKARRKIAGLATLRASAIGDSIVAMQSGSPSTAAPNGTVRDRSTVSGNYLNNGYVGADVIAAWPLFTAAQLGRTADAEGTVYSKFGFMWNLVADLQAMGYTLGTNLYYDNWGVAGQTSAGLVSGASPSAWLSAFIATAPDIAVFNVGMNEYGSSTTQANMVIALNACRAAGIECVVMGVARKRATTTGWHTTNAALRNAAEATGSAFVDVEVLYKDDFLPALGMSGSDIAAANANNHPGIREHLVIGKHLSRLVLD
ncbi:MAG: hypothetical protein ACXW27_09155 [Allosphingosinicella sp.]